MRLDEGRKTVGLWLPLALAHIVKAIGEVFGGSSDKLSDILGGFALPHLADAVRREEETAEADRLVANFKALQDRFKNGKL